MKETYVNNRIYRPAETGFRKAETFQDGICNCVNCKRFENETCPESNNERSGKTVCDYFKIDCFKVDGGQ